MKTDADLMRIVAVAIGRNEGERLRHCLASLSGWTDAVVYVDSGSTDGSLAIAREYGAVIVELDMSMPFTAARARNAGVAQAKSLATFDLVQFVDGDCEMRPDWPAAAQHFLALNPQVAAVCGRRRERHPESSVWNRVTDAEWDTSVGETDSSGGDVLMRLSAFDAVGGFDPTFIAGEEPELCVRLRAAGWQIWRLDVEMTLHDAAMTRFGQWWTRVKRGGYAYALGHAKHGMPPERFAAEKIRRTLLWGLLIPLLILASVVLLGPFGLLAAAVYPVQITRLARRDGDWQRATLLTLGKFAETQGILGLWWDRLRRHRRGLIEYK